MTMPALTRRSALFAAAALPFAPALMPRAAHAAAEMMGATVAPFNRFKLGGFEVTTLLAGTRALENPQETFGLNASPAEFAALSQAHFIPADKSQNFFTPTVVNTGAELVLFDTGLAPEAITGALAAAGYTPDQIDVVVLTHMHGDHIGGLSGDAGVTFANARYVTGSVEHNHWAQAGNEGFDTKVKPLVDKMTMLEDGGSVASGVTAMAAFGHSPGHMAYRLESDGQQLVLAADTANHYVWSLQKPDWEVRFDMDKAAAAATRKQLFGMLAADRVPFVGYHMPFPGVGYVEAMDDGFRYVPVSYQMLLNG
ncbi:MBL fold metallo-hydrolase [Pseudotabrizicola alkalilacus]|uniref:MBL fold metallo-hydrolase n=1 Tax=Pseudotabrizicola alkalilacus TaxID=2305252 RepID=A0A411Z6X1_9RHOB|nr:MBL fold metallo-hydrolase [Pseudotabrizicola alkalilacus]RGP38850.1 MBL fold metallo-hydrolase [Pseudotabrizicola alkalilacus]